ncbi:MAG: hypothetical protein KBF37_05065 [Saprospiraceae bacterium]|nr:hypothetical protein [Saprospiraceae bacterium]MBP9209679.1 hypothetical protein [Saprospiraceae bacterium]
MTYSGFSWKSFAWMTLLLGALSCAKPDREAAPKFPLNARDAGMVEDWSSLALTLTSQCNGYSDPVASRAMFYLAVCMYETLLPGFDNHVSTQVRLQGLNTTLPQPEPGLSYNPVIVANQALYQLVSELYGPAGPANLEAVANLKDKYIHLEGATLEDDIILRSKELGNSIGWKLIEYSKADGLAEAFLDRYPPYSPPQQPGFWRPTPPDYFSKALLPYWGNAKLALKANETLLNAPAVLEYSESPNSIIFAEATEVYNYSRNLNLEQREQLAYWDSDADYHASPFQHNFLLMRQLLSENNVSLDRACRLFLRLAIAQFDGNIVAWHLKYKSNLLRPATYIKLHIDRYFVPEYSALPVPEYVSERALIYGACSVIFSEEFGYRIPFMDYTQEMRQDLRDKQKSFGSFSEMAHVAALADLYNATQFRTSIESGISIGQNLGIQVQKLELEK